MPTLDPDTRQRLTTTAQEFLQASDRDQRMHCIERFGRLPECNSVMDYFWFLETQDHTSYSQERCLRDLALLGVAGPYLDPRDVAAGLDAIMRRCSGMDCQAVSALFDRVSALLSGSTEKWLAERMRQYPQAFYGAKRAK